MVYDIVVLGSGLVGSVLVTLLKEKGLLSSLKVAIIDPKPFEALLEKDSAHASQDHRTTAISYGAAQILKEAGVWEGLSAHTSPIQTIKTREAGFPHTLKFAQEELTGRAEPMGYMASNARLRHTLNNAICALNEVTLLGGVTATAVIKETFYNTVHLSNGESIRARLLVGAEGANSPSRDFMGIKSSQNSYNQTAMVAHVWHEKPHHGTAYEIFTPYGPLAFLPMRDEPLSVSSAHQKSDIVLQNEKTLLEHEKFLLMMKESTKAPAFDKAPACESHLAGDAISSKSPQAPDFKGYQSAIVWSSSLPLKDMTEEERIAHMYALFPDLGTLAFKTPAHFFPLFCQKTTSMIAHRFALVGDAGHVMHPIAGQGVNLGWRDAKVLADIIEKAVVTGCDVGSVSSVLQPYNQHRMHDQKPLMAVSHSLVKLFGVEAKGPLTRSLQLMRNYGLDVVNRIAPLKRFFMRKAMGI